MERTRRTQTPNAERGVLKLLNQNLIRGTTDRKTQNAAKLKNENGKRRMNAITIGHHH